MAFTPKDWQDAPSTATPITSVELERIEAGVVEALRPATEAQTGNVELASATEMTAGTDTTRAPSVKRVADYVASSISTAIGSLPSATQATESASGIVELATSTEMTTGTDLARVPAVKRVADYVASAISALSSSVNDLLDDKAALVHTHTSDGISGTLDLSKTAPGSIFVINYVSGSWRYNNTVITTRPSSRSDIRMWAIGGATPPGFALTHDLHSPEV